MQIRQWWRLKWNLNPLSTLHKISNTNSWPGVAYRFEQTTVALLLHQILNNIVKSTLISPECFQRMYRQSVSIIFIQNTFFIPLNFRAWSGVKFMVIVFRTGRSGYLFISLPIHNVPKNISFIPKKKQNYGGWQSGSPQGKSTTVLFVTNSLRFYHWTFESNKIYVKGDNFVQNRKVNPTEAALITECRVWGVLTWQKWRFKY